MTRELGAKRGSLGVGEHMMPTTEPVVAVASRPWRDVNVHVKDVLAGGRAIVDEEIVAIGTQRLDQSTRPAVRFAGHLRKRPWRRVRATA